MCRHNVFLCSLTPVVYQEWRSCPYHSTTWTMLSRCALPSDITAPAPAPLFKNDESYMKQYYLETDRHQYYCVRAQRRCCTQILNSVSLATCLQVRESLAAIESAAASSTGEPRHIMVVGAGYAGVELAAVVAERLLAHKGLSGQVKVRITYLRVKSVASFSVGSYTCSMWTVSCTLSICTMWLVCLQRRHEAGSNTLTPNTTFDTPFALSLYRHHA